MADNDFQPELCGYRGRGPDVARISRSPITDTRMASGTHSCANSISFGWSSPVMEVVPVTLPPGRARLAAPLPSRAALSMRSATSAQRAAVAVVFSRLCSRCFSLDHLVGTGDHAAPTAASQNRRAVSSAGGITPSSAVANLLDRPPRFQLTERITD
jgi:hypothetical protein